MLFINMKELNVKIGDFAKFVAYKNGRDIPTGDFGDVIPFKAEFKNLDGDWEEADRFAKKEEPTYKVIFKSGKSFVGAGNHMLCLDNSDDGIFIPLETAKRAIEAGDHVKLSYADDEIVSIERVSDKEDVFSPSLPKTSTFTDSQGIIHHNSYLVNECLEETGLKGSPDVFKARGDLGANPSAVAAFLYQNRNKKIIILDDCDSMVMKNVPGNVSNMLKGALDPDGHEVTISPTIAKNATNLIGADQIADEVIDPNTGDIVDVDGAETEDGKVMMPTQFDWSTPKMIMISNANEFNINEALLSRCDYYCLHLTQEEYLVRLAIVIKKMKFDNPNYTEQQYEDAKNIVYSVMTACIEAANNGIAIGGVKIKLTHALEFRIIRTLVDAWLARVEDIEFTEHLSHDEACKKAYRGFVKFDVAPLL